MKLGAFSLSLAVADLAASQAFYMALGFEVVGGAPEQNWLILRNGDTTLGLFEGMFPKNTITFNPGWDGQAQPLSQFDDVRVIQAELEAKGLKLESRVEEGTSGPASILLMDPDGNPVLIDQHVSKP